MICQHKTSEIQLLVARIEDYMARGRKVTGRVYSALKEKDIRDLLADLEGAKSSLVLAYLMYTDTERRQRDRALSNALTLHGAMLNNLQNHVTTGDPDISQQLTLLQSSMIQQQSKVIVSGTHATTTNRPTMMRVDVLEASNTSMSDQCGRTNRVRQLRQKKSELYIRLRFQLPTWLYCRVWDLSITRAHCRWGMHLQTYNVVPKTAAIFRKAEIGDILGLRRLIETGEGSLMDVSDNQGPYLTLVDVSWLTLITWNSS